MRKLEGRLPAVKIEVVTSTFVASGVPEGIHDLGRLLENMNNTAMSRQIELREAAIRPLYRAQAQVELDAPLLVRRDEIIFANFEGPHFTRGTVRPAQVDVPALLMAPPFQILGSVAFSPDAEATAALRALVQGFFIVREAQVFDADGNALGEGEQIVVNGMAVQMTAATRRHIQAVATTQRAEARAEDMESDDEPNAEQEATRAA